MKDSKFKDSDKLWTKLDRLGTVLVIVAVVLACVYYLVKAL